MGLVKIITEEFAQNPSFRALAADEQYKTVEQEYLRRRKQLESKVSPLTDAATWTAVGAPLDRKSIPAAVEDGEFDPIKEVERRVAATPKDGSGYMMKREDIASTTPGLLRAIDDRFNGHICLLTSVKFVTLAVAPGGPCPNKLSVQY